MKETETSCEQLERFRETEPMSTKCEFAFLKIDRQREKEREI